MSSKKEKKKNLKRNIPASHLKEGKKLGRFRAVSLSTPEGMGKREQQGMEKYLFN